MTKNLDASVALTNAPPDTSGKLLFERAVLFEYASCRGRVHALADLLRTMEFPEPNMGRVRLLLRLAVVECSKAYAHWENALFRTGCKPSVNERDELHAWLENAASYSVDPGSQEVAGTDDPNPAAEPPKVSPELTVGAIVRSLRMLDPEGADVVVGDVGVVMGRRDGCGFLVRWMNRDGDIVLSGACIVYAGDVAVLEAPGKVGG